MVSTPTVTTSGHKGDTSSVNTPASSVRTEGYSSTSTCRALARAELIGADPPPASALQPPLRLLLLLLLAAPCPWHASSTSRPSHEHRPPQCGAHPTSSRPQTGAAVRAHHLVAVGEGTSGTPAVPVAAHSSRCYAHFRRSHTTRGMSGGRNAVLRLQPSWRAA